MLHLSVMKCFVDAPIGDGAPFVKMKLSPGLL